jgi:hypothetical protein
MWCGNSKDAHGEVCPANWKESIKTILRDPFAKLDYFSTTAADGAHENEICTLVQKIFAPDPTHLYSTVYHYTSLPQFRPSKS